MDVSGTGATYGSVFNEPFRAERREGGREEPARPDPAREAESPRRGDEVPPMMSLLNRVMQRRDHKVKLTVHKPTNRVIIRITDSETGEVINEIPRESYLDMVAHFLSNLDKVHGMNLDEIV